MENADEIADEFIERMGLITEAEGMPRIAGRIMGFLVIYGGPFSFSELAERLKVSRSSISTNTRLLQKLGAIERTTSAGDRQDYFKIRPDAYARILEQSVSRMQYACETIDNTKQGLPKDWKDAQNRLSDLFEFYQENINGARKIISLMSNSVKKS
ncbi:MAG: MarR family transcriptional regulator [Candidatus Obscuribacterales bacterium]|nr:MarR family transcriptional regulator [Candidatus Obscuribacterales bacterium]